MNWHFFFSLLDLAGWVSLAIFFSAISNHKQRKNISSISSILIAISAGCISVLHDGLPNIGISFTSFIYVGMAIVTFTMYQAIKKELFQKSLNRQIKSLVSKNNIH